MSASENLPASGSTQPLDLPGNKFPPSPAPSGPHTDSSVASDPPKYKIATELVFTESSDQYNASSVPIYQV